MTDEDDKRTRKPEPTTLQTDATIRDLILGGEIRQMRSILHGRPHLTDSDREAFKSASKARDDAIFDVAAREEAHGESEQTRVDALRVNLGYAGFLAEQLAGYSGRTNNPSGVSLFSNRQEGYAEEIVELAQQQPQAQTAPAIDDEDEKKKRHAGQGVDMGNPAHAQLGANIRPDIGSGPAGLETYTTQKSATYQASPDAERQGEPPTLTLEAIAADPWNAVELPLPANADKELLTAARSAAEYCVDGHHELMMKARAGEYAPPGWTGAEGEPDAHEYDEDRWLQALDRFELVTSRLAEPQQAEQSDRVAAFLKAEREARDAGQSAEESPQPQQQQGDDQTRAETQTGDRVAEFLKAESADRKERREAVKALGGEEATQEQGEDMAPVIGGGFSIS